MGNGPTEFLDERRAITVREQIVLVSYVNLALLHLICVTLA